MNARRRILLEHFKTMHRVGFQAMRTDKVVAEMGITKGAFYHYFPGKNELGYAIVDEIITPLYTGLWKPFAEAEAQHDEVLRTVLSRYASLIDPQTIQWGCPLQNLIVEMAGIDEGFQERLDHTVREMARLAGAGLERGQQAGVFKPDLEVERQVWRLLSVIAGAFNMGKATRSTAIFHGILEQIQEECLAQWKR